MLMFPITRSSFFLVSYSCSWLFILQNTCTLFRMTKQTNQRKFLKFHFTPFNTYDYFRKHPAPGSLLDALCSFSWKTEKRIKPQIALWQEQIWFFSLKPLHAEKWKSLKPILYRYNFRNLWLGHCLTAQSVLINLCFRFIYLPWVHVDITSIQTLSASSDSK